VLKELPDLVQSVLVAEFKLFVGGKLDFLEPAQLVVPESEKPFQCQWVIHFFSYVCGWCGQD
jgi:hypothetical protein